MLCIVAACFAQDIEFRTGMLSISSTTTISQLDFVLIYIGSLSARKGSSRSDIDTVVTAFFMSTETHAKRFLTVWKRSVSTTLKRSFTVLANQIIVSETFQAFQILTNHISVRKTLSWKPCLVSNVFSVCRISQSKSRRLNLFYIFFFFFFFFFQFHLIIIVIKLIKIIVK